MTTTEANETKTTDRLSLMERAEVVLDGWAHLTRAHERLGLTDEAEKAERVRAAVEKGLAHLDGLEPLPALAALLEATKAEADYYGDEEARSTAVLVDELKAIMRSMEPEPEAATFAVRGDSGRVFEFDLEAVLASATEWERDFLGTVERYGRECYVLSAKQEAILERILGGDERPTPTKAPEPEPAHPLVGATVLVTKWLTKRVGEEVGTETPFRVLDVLDVEAESAKAWRVRVRYSEKPVSFCRVCWRDLTDEVSVASCIGPVCAKKVGVDRKDRKKALADLHALVEEVGEFTLWLPKSQVEEVETHDHEERGA